MLFSPFRRVLAPSSDIVSIHSQSNLALQAAPASARRETSGGTGFKPEASDCACVDQNPETKLQIRPQSGPGRRTFVGIAPSGETART
jgi:hypothetical protein